jgi:hypothetical protein
MKIVDAAIEACRARGVPGVEKAIEFLTALVGAPKGGGSLVLDELPCKDGQFRKGLKRLPRCLTDLK